MLDMRRRELLGTIAAATTLAAQTRPTIQRKGRIRQGLWTSNFGQTDLSFEQLCAEAARLGAYGFDMRTPEQWPVLRRHGLEPTLGGTGGVNFQDGLIHSQGHEKLVESVNAWIDTLADNNVRTFITVGGQRRGMSDEEGLRNAVAVLKRLQPKLEARNITIALENMNNKRLDPAYGREDQICGHFSWGIELCKRVASPNVKMVCDLYHLQIMDGDLARNIRDNIDWIAHFHTAGVPTRGELDDSQEINYRYIAQVIADTGYQGYVSHEFRPSPGRDPLESIAQAMDIMDV